MPAEIIEANKLYDEYKLDLALQTLNKLSQGQIEGLPIEILLHFHTFKTTILATMDNWREALIFAEISCEIASKFDIFHNSIEKIDSFLLLAEALGRNGKYEKSFEILKEVDKIIENLPDLPDKIKKEKRGEKLYIRSWVNTRIGQIEGSFKIYEELHEIYSELGDMYNLVRNYSRNGWAFLFLGNMDEALKYLNKSDELFQKLDKSPFNSSEEIRNLLFHGAISGQKGDLFESLNYYNEALKLANENSLLLFISASLNNLGEVYLKLANWEQAILCYSKAIKMAENTLDTANFVMIIQGLFLANLNKGDIKIARENLERIRKIKNQELGNKQINQMYRLCEALLLGKSKRIRDLGKAQEILKEISEEEIIFIGITISSLINLCEMLVLEFRDSKDPEVLNELNPIIDKLFRIAENQKSYLIMAETLLLKSKIETISLKLTEARQLLNQAQIITEKYGLRNLAIKISVENDELIKNLAVFEKMRLENEPIENRFEEIKIEKQLNEMLHKNKFEIPEIKDEEPVLIMIMADSGLPLYTRVFKDEWKVDDQLFGGFLSAFNSFSDEIFKKGFDRAVFGNYSILMYSFENFMISYIFLGQSYLAKQRFSKFTEKIQNTENILKKLIYSKNTGRTLYPKDIPVLEAQTNEIFVQKNLFL